MINFKFNYSFFANNQIAHLSCQPFCRFLLSTPNSNVVASVPIWTSEGHVEMPLQQIEIDAAPKTTPFERAFNPYDFNGG